MIHKLLCLLILSLTFAGAARAQSGRAQSEAEIRDQILQVDRERYEAMQKRDMSALDRLHADGLVFVNTRGQLLNKAQYLDEIRTGNLKFMTVDVDQYRFAIYGDTVIMSGRAKSVVEYHGKINRRPRRFTSVFIKLQGQWRLVSHQATLIADE